MSIQIIVQQIGRTKGNTSLFVPILLAIILMCSCAKDHVTQPSVDSNKIQFSFTIPNQVPGSYATVGAFPSEREFDDASVIFYDASGNYVAHALSIAASNNSTGNFDVVKPAKIEENKQYKVLIIANLNHYIDKTKYASTSDYIDANKKLQYDAMRYSMSAMSINRISNYLPMFAQSEANISESTVISIVFERCVARFDLVSLAQNLDIEWIKVCNYNSAGYFFHNEYNVIGSSIINGAGASDVETTPHKVTLTRRAAMSDPLGPQSNDNGGLYAFPNINTNTGLNDSKTTCLLIKGTYSYTDNDGNIKTKESYYRVNVCMSGKPQNLKRNNIYRITIKSVSNGGADSEDDGMKNPTANVDYEINDWTIDNSQEIITDANDNYLAISPVSAYLGGDVGSSLTGSIKVKDGSPWIIEKLLPTDDWFSVERTTDGKGFIVTALKDNLSSNTRSSKIRVSVPSSELLKYDVYIYQYSKITSSDAILMVDGHSNDFSVDVDKYGQTHEFQVLLGEDNSSATMTWYSGATNMIIYSSPTIGSPGIGNNATLNLIFGFNVSGAPRTSTYKIKRKDSSNPDMELLITFNQEHASDLIAVSPTKLFNNNTIDGFMNLSGSANGYKCQSQRVYITTAHTSYSPKWKATSTFNTYDVALVSKPASPTTTYPNGAALSNTATGNSNEWFDIAVARCGPGDADLTGTITITIEEYNINGEVVPGAVYVFPLTVYSSLRSGFTQMGKLLYHDRNVGTPDYLVTDESAISPALPYSNYTGDYQSAASSLTNHKAFRGSYYNFSQARTQCPEGWRIPTGSEFTTLAPSVQFAKAGSRPYIVANEGRDKDIKGCYFPWSGTGMALSYLCGYYWSSTSGDGYYYLDITPPTEAYLSRTYNSINQYTLRCVKDIVE